MATISMTCVIRESAASVDKMLFAYQRGSKNVDACLKPAEETSRKMTTCTWSSQYRIPKSE